MLITFLTHVAEEVREILAGLGYSRIEDIIYTPYFSGVSANYLRGSIEKYGLNPAEVLGRREGASLGIDETDSGPKAWRDFWSAVEVTVQVG